MHFHSKRGNFGGSARIQDLKKFDPKQWYHITNKNLQEGDYKVSVKCMAAKI